MAAVGSAWLRPAWADELDDTIALFKKNEETAKFFSGAHGYAVFPKIFKGAIGVGGACGDGRVFEKGKVIGDSTPGRSTRSRSEPDAWDCSGLPGLEAFSPLRTAARLPQRFPSRRGCDAGGIWRSLRVISYAVLTAS